MGQPKFQRRKYERPFRPYDKVRIERERKLLQEFGLRRKKEIWRTESILRDFRRRARELQARKNEQLKKELLERLNKLGIHCSTLDDVLGIDIRDLLDRRLQTVVHKRGFAETPNKARQLIVHGHVVVNGRRTRWPSFLVTKALENKIGLNPKMRAAYYP